jgi:transcriptional regulator with XRE-family HTH domain|tara:strand:- start:2123 stop:2359 length:237 start_codon:yes stop_codon:yes gene_type:complete
VPEAKDQKLIELLGLNIRKHRIKKGFSQEWLSEQVDTSQVQISRIESGITSVSCLTLYKIGKALDVSLDDLFVEVKVS